MDLFSLSPIIGFFLLLDSLGLISVSEKLRLLPVGVLISLIVMLSPLVHGDQFTYLPLLESSNLYPDGSSTRTVCLHMCFY